MLPHKVFTGVERVQADGSECRGEGSVRARTRMNEAARGWAERKVRATRRHGVATIDRDVVKAIVSLRIGDSQTVLGASHSNGYALDRVSIGVENPARDSAGLRRG